MIKYLRLFSNLKFAIFLLLTIAFCSIIGSVVEQDKTLKFYQSNYPVVKPLFGFINWKFIIFFQLDHLYRNDWFILLLLLLGLSLFSCTISQQLPTLKFSRHCHFIKKARVKKNFIINSKTLKIHKFLYSLNKQNYFIFQQRRTFYNSKGLIGRIAPIFVHLSIILILLGSILASIFGFNAQEFLSKTEISRIQNIATIGNFSKINQAPIRLNDFWITYRKTGQIRQFYSNLSILDNKGTERKLQTIYVNNPFIYKNLTIYQTDWLLDGIRIGIESLSVQLPFFKINNFSEKGDFLTLLPLNQSFQLIQIKTYHGYLYNLQGKLIRVIDLNEYLDINTIKLKDIISSTGLQIKSDPGIVYIYIGFSFLMISTLVSYISFAEIWFIKKIEKKELIINAKANRSINQLEMELFKSLN
uniref:c-type cytochrome biogenensis protein n=1 Tax=Haramonas pauciplastida TaxID=478668 RepID=UPI002114AC18|nr:c-type cytochrome biogenensis protein [Haramonas pauciplastida]YP_010444180.1 c-type cytochrome biogenensis protein [Haramonas pauciplastida]UTE95032.1 c-type cytochrome biogenensis protein [Haramonas pauciplastida]UTE95066.1 c-type cytochrome biogenensis protein [Haramonas pauciplastida]